MESILGKISKRVIIVFSLFLLISSIGLLGYQINQAQAVNLLTTQSSNLCNINRDLYEGISGSDVKELQQYLNNSGFILAQTGVGSPGRETNYFGPLTKKALIDFQIKNKLNNTGIFDSATRDFLDCKKFKQIVSENVTTNKYALSGIITGIIGPVVLKNNEDFIIIMPGDNANFTFPNRLSNGFNYSIVVTTNYLNQKCYLNNGIGTIKNADVNNIEVACGLGLYYNPFTTRFGGGGSEGSSSIATYTVTFDGNTSDGGSTATQTLKYNTPTALTANGYTKTDYTFVGWNTLADGTGTDYADEALYTIGAGNVILYAKWKINTYTVTFDGNTADGGSTATQTLDYNTPTALTANGYTKTSYTFVGWNTLADGTGTDYADEALYTIGAGNVILYAKWIFVCGSSVTFTYKGSPVTYGTVSNVTTGECWLDRNLGATRVALSSTDSDAYGDSFQWGRPDDGHQVRTGGTQSDQVATITPGIDIFIITNADWSSIDSDGVLRSSYLAKTDGMGICPTGFRMPTETEWEEERLTWSSSGSPGAFASPLKLTATGIRHWTDGGLFVVDTVGSLWSSTADGVGARYLYYSMSVDNVYTTVNRAFGMSVRCIKD